MKRKWIIPKRTEVYPWEREYAGKNYKPETSARDTALVRYHSFSWMVFAAIQPDSKFDLTEIINSYWRYAFTKPFPTEGGKLETLYTTIAEKLYEDDAENYGVNLDESPFVPFNTLFREPGWAIVKDLHIEKINILKEYDMATAKPKGKGKVSKDKAKAKEVPAKASAKTDDEKKPKMTKKRQAEIRVCELLLEREYTDTEISEKLMEELEYNMVPRRVKKRRFRLNSGGMEDFGFPKPDEPVEEIGGSDESEEKPSKEKKSSKAEKEESSVKKEKPSKKGKTSAKPGKKKLIIKKKK